MSRVPSFNGLVTELQEAKRGFGLHVRAIEKLNTMKHLRHALNRPGDSGDLDTALEVRGLLTEFVNNCDTLTSRHKTLLDNVFNLSDNHNLRLGQREAILETELKIGKKLRMSETHAAILIVANQLHASAVAS